MKLTIGRSTMSHLIITVIVLAVISTGCATMQPRHPRTGDTVIFTTWDGCQHEGTIISTGEKYAITFIGFDNIPDTAYVYRHHIIRNKSAGTIKGR